MDFNVAMRFVWVRARAEAQNLNQEHIYPEHLFLAVLKLAELSSKDFPNCANPEEIDAEIAEIAKILRKTKIDAAAGRALLRRALKASRPNGDPESLVNDMLKRAAREPDMATALDVARELVARPTPVIKAVFNISPKAEKEPAARLDAVSSLAALSERVNAMRCALLNDIRGQDYAIHTFAEGIFNSEALGRDGKARPKALFVFAGPPGVGKTFLAEKGAQYLKIPFKRFDMSGFSDHQASNTLIGFDNVYKDSKKGVLTDFVDKNPNCILLFDEIEKAHINVVHLFLQILDAGVLHDVYSDKDVTFDSAVVIFTTNAGRQLYEENEYDSAAVSPGVILDALEKDIDSRTGRPFFPAAICSRMSTGYCVLFNHLRSQSLTEIAEHALKEAAARFEEQFGIDVVFDEYLIPTLLFSEGGRVDARKLTSRVNLFFKNEIFKVTRLWEKESFAKVISKLHKLSFEVETDNLGEAEGILYPKNRKGNILYFGNDGAEFSKKLTKHNVMAVNSFDEARELPDISDADMALIDIASAINARGNGKSPFDTVGAFQHIPIASSAVKKLYGLFKETRQYLPDLPVYLLIMGDADQYGELISGFVKSGAAGAVLSSHSDDAGVFTDKIDGIVKQLRMQNSAAELARQSKALSFETAPKLSVDETILTIRLRELRVKLQIRGNDNVLDAEERPNTRFDDVIGAAEAKEKLVAIAEYLQNPKKRMGQKLPRGVLLYGPPGTGKTLLAKALAGESGVAYIPATGTGFVTKYQGSGPEAVRDLFSRARRYAPAVVFIDEIDAIGRTRQAGISAHGEEMALNALLTEMDGFSTDPKRPVFVLAATNFGIDENSRLGTLDPALLRRFDRKILVDLPNQDDRKKFLEVMLKRQPVSDVSDNMILTIAKRSAGLSLSNLASILDIASDLAAKSDGVISDEILDEAFETNTYGSKKDWGRDYLERVARHESGHALMSFLHGKTPEYLTIVARGDHGGYMEHQSSENTPMLTKSELLSRVRTSLGGRAAEIVYYGVEDGLSSGASSDLANATKTVKKILFSYGMDEETGLAALPDDSLTERNIQRVNEVLRDEMQAAVSAISENRAKIDALVDALLEKNKLSREEIDRILKNGDLE
ncbi:MAG: AAA family ATPase [Synergistaceae bacterium]|jgi:ATP-dependent metalloprotease FtsH|nr:AAA family ATPase [Synergistaceae bacterium]